jgi:hypothetical protein
MTGSKRLRTVSADTADDLHYAVAMTAPLEEAAQQGESWLGDGAYHISTIDI